jgi:SAM-dependent methyltransferase
LANAPIFDRVTSQEMRRIVDRENDHVTIKPWIKEGIAWFLGDARDSEFLSMLGRRDMVVANNFLCHMDPPDAERCLRKIARMVNPGGNLFVSGIDLDIRVNVAQELARKPVPDLMEEIHEGEPVLGADWPWRYWGLEPFNKRRHDWKVRYASAFQLNQKI